MSAEPKPFASLSSGLLARKGAARPAMRPQGFGQMGAGLEDLGWNDLGFEPPKPNVAPIRDEEHDAFGEELPAQPSRNPLAALTPIGSPVHDQQAEIEDRFSPEGDDEPVDEDYDETAELYEPEEVAEVPQVAEIPQVAEARPVHPAVAAVVPTPAPRRAPKARSAAAWSASKGPADER